MNHYKVLQRAVNHTRAVFVTTAKIGSKATNVDLVLPNDGTISFELQTGGVQHRNTIERHRLDGGGKEGRPFG